MANISTTCPCPHVGIRVGLVYCPLGIVCTSIPCHVGSCMKLAHVHVCVTRLRFLPFKLLDPCRTGRFFFSTFFFSFRFFFFFFDLVTYLEKFGFRWTDVSEVFCLPSLYDTVRNTGEEKWKKKRTWIERVRFECCRYFLFICILKIFLVFLLKNYRGRSHGLHLYDK